MTGLVHRLGPCVRRVAGPALAVLSLAACAAWALRPLGPARADTPEIVAMPPGDLPGSARLALDVTAFSTPLWIAPPPPPASPSTAAALPPPAPPPPPLRWQLLAIVRHEGAYRAFIYDPDADKLLVLGEGDQSGARRVTSVLPASVDVRDGAVHRTLALREPNPGGRP